MILCLLYYEILLRSSCFCLHTFLKFGSSLYKKIHRIESYIHTYTIFQYFKQRQARFMFPSESQYIPSMYEFLPLALNTLTSWKRNHHGIKTKHLGAQIEETTTVTFNVVRRVLFFQWNFRLSGKSSISL